MAYEGNPYDTYDPNGTPIDELTARLMQLQGRIASTISEVSRVESELKEKQSQISQTVDEISLEVFEIDSTSGERVSKISRLEVRADGIDSTVAQINEDLMGMSGSISSIEQRADSIESSVSSFDTRIGTAESNITQLAGNISSMVSWTDYNGNQIASLINQSATTITLAASKINLLGITNVAETLYIGNAVNDQNQKSIRFRGPNATAGIYSNSADGITVAAMNDVRLSSSYYISLSAPYLNLTGVDDIIWGGNSPDYAQSAGNANTVGGYGVSSLVRRYGSYELGFEVTSEGSINVYRSGSYIGGIRLDYTA